MPPRHSLPFDAAAILADLRQEAARLVRRVLRRPLQHALGASFVAIAVAVAVNGAFLQAGKHPAPLFGGASDGDAALASVGTEPELTDAEEADAPGIETVLAGLARPDQPPVRPTAATPASGLVLDVQAELAALGLFRGERDGVLDGGTVQAIEAFQRSRGLPVTGEPSVDLLAALATRLPETRAGMEAVARVQAALNEKGFGPLEVDGIMGRKTGEAIRRFERSAGLPETGEVSAGLERALGLTTGA